MPAQFGGVNCDLIKGIPQQMREKAVSYQVLGVDGHGYHLVGKRGQARTVRLIEYGAEAIVDIWIGAIEALESTTITYTDDFGKTSVPHFVEGVGVPRKTPAIGEGGMRGEIFVTVRPVQ